VRSLKPENPFLPVFIDKKTEAALGPFPFDRAILAAAVKRSAELGAKGAVLKFFLDLPRSQNGDRALADAMSSIKVILQAGDGTMQPAELPDKFKLRLPLAGVKSLHASTGGIPIPELIAKAHDIGFVDNFAENRMPVIEQYGGQYVKWLATACLELALGVTAEASPGKSIRFGNAERPLDNLSRLPINFPGKDDLEYIPLVDFLGRNRRPDLKGRVVILGYDGDNIGRVQTPIGLVKAHRAFYYALTSLHTQLGFCCG
jgi:hypothetical protein